MRSSFSMPLLYHAYVYLEFLILACTIYILAPNLFYYIIKNLYTLFFIITRIATLFQYNFLIASTLNSNNRNSYISIDQRAAMPSSYLLHYTYFPLPSARFRFASSRCMLSPSTSIKKYNIRLISRMSTYKKRTNRFMQA